MARRFEKLLEMLRYLNDLGDDMFPMDRKSAWKGYMSEAKRTADRLEKKGWAESVATADGRGIIITDEGRKQVMTYLIGQVPIKRGKWDGKWRIIFFDISNRERNKRDRLRNTLKNLGCRELLESTYVTPYECKAEIDYLREALDIRDGVRIGVLESIEGEEELKKEFGLES